MLRPREVGWGEFRHVRGIINGICGYFKGGKMVSDGVIFACKHSAGEGGRRKKYTDICLQDEIMFTSVII